MVPAVQNRDAGLRQAINPGESILLRSEGLHVSESGLDLYNRKVNQREKVQILGEGKLSTELERNSDHQKQWYALSLNDILDNCFIFSFFL